MCGVNMELGKSFVLAVLDGMGRGDHLSLSLFGSEVKHLTRRMIPATPEGLARPRTLMAGAEASMGGTEMDSALEAVLRDIRPPTSAEVPAKVLLVTDGEIWDAERTVGTALAGGQRVFAAGIGAAPGEALLKGLGDGTAGACEFLPAGEDVRGAAERLSLKMRTPAADEVKIDWGRAPLWETPVPSSLHHGLTVHAMAGFDDPPETGPVLSWRRGGLRFRSEAGPLAFGGPADLARLAGAARLKSAADPATAAELALRYRLVSPHTSLILVDERKGRGAGGLPVLQTIPQMMPAMYGGFGLFSRQLGEADRTLFSVSRSRINQIEVCARSMSKLRRPTKGRWLRSSGEAPAFPASGDLSPGYPGGRADDFTPPHKDLIQSAQALIAVLDPDGDLEALSSPPHEAACQLF
jgi:Ca-activated chloride channel family protein